MQIAIGVGRLGKLIRMVPHSVMLGFVNGLAIVIGLAQLSSFKTLSGDGGLIFLQGMPLVWMLGMVTLTMAIIWLLPKVTQAVPASLVAILSVTLLCAGINQMYKTDSNQSNLLATVGDMLDTNSKAKAIADIKGVDAHGHPLKSADLEHENEPAEQESEMTLASLVLGSTTEISLDELTDEKQAAIANVLNSESESNGISGGLPMPYFLKAENIVPLNFNTLKIIFPYAIILCGVGLIESLMTLTLVDEITETRGQGNRECIGQGTANLVCGLFGGMGGCAMIGQSLINVNSGGRGRLSGITAALCLLAFVLFLGPWITQIPMAALVGVMFMVVVGTFEWASLKMFRRIPKADIIVMLFVTLYTVFMHDLASAVILGVVISALVFAWNHATHMGADVSYNEHGSKIYQVHGPLFFASVTSFKDMFTIADDPDDVVIDFYYSRVYDQSALEAINGLAEKYQASGKRLHLRHLSPECRGLLDNAGDLVEVNVSEDPHYHVASDRLA
jgi:SulP family sulfate permease